MSEEKPQPRVIVFSTPTCTFCNMVKKYFREKNIKFRDVDVSRDPIAARDMVRRSGQQGVPVVDIGGKIVVGFDRPRINALLGIK
ncbi:MAG: glutaredoxin family protein [Anaerolineales bacterium]